MAEVKKRFTELPNEATAVTDDLYTAVDSATNGTMKFRLSRITEKIGDLAGLDTTNKSNLVAAINEVASSGGGGGSSVSPYTSNPSALGTANAGSSAKYSRGDHVHPMPSASDVGAASEDELIDLYPTDTASGAIASFIDGADGLPVKSLTVDVEPIQSGSGDPSPDNIRPITGHTQAMVWREATYDTTAQPQTTIPLGQTVYGGTLDVLTGVLTVDRAMYAFNGTESSWIKSSSYRGSFYRSWVTMPSGNGVNQGAFICSHAGYVSNFYEYAYGKCSSDSALNLWVMQDPDATIDDLKAFLAEQYANGTPVTVCYTLSNPITIDLTDIPTISTLLGQNNIWSDVGDVEVEYRASGSLMSATDKGRLDDLYADYSSALTALGVI